MSMFDGDPRVKEGLDKIQIPDVKSAPQWVQALCSWWHAFLVKLGLRKDWLDPDNAPPGFEEILRNYEAHGTRHAFLAMPDLKCCAKCGGGRKHPIHGVEILGQEFMNDADQTQKSEAA